MRAHFSLAQAASGLKEKLLSIGISSIFEMCRLKMRNGVMVSDQGACGIVFEVGLPAGMPTSFGVGHSELLHELDGLSNSIHY